MADTAVATPPAAEEQVKKLEKPEKPDEEAYEAKLATLKKEHAAAQTEFASYICPAYIQI